MSKLTTERLENIANGNCGCLNETAMQMARELLSLRTDAGDDLKSGNDFLRQEIEDWKEANRRAEAERDEARKEVEKQIEITYEAKAVASRIQKVKHDNDEFANQRFMDDKAKIETLTAERDRCKSQVECLRQNYQDLDRKNLDLTAELTAITAELDAITRERDQFRSDRETVISKIQALDSELATLRSCPEMGEIDAIEDWLEGKEIEFGVVRRIKRLVEMVGQLSAALTEERKRADEAERLLRKFIASKDGAMQEIREWATEDPDCRRIIELCGEGE